MAHSDILIFLNSITWIFFLFLFVYFFLVLFFLPTFYKKVRIRSLVRGVYGIVLFFISSNSVSNVYLYTENFRLCLSNLLSLSLYLSSRRSNFRIPHFKYLINCFSADLPATSNAFTVKDADLSSFLRRKSITHNRSGFFVYDFYITASNFQK